MHTGLNYNQLFDSAFFNAEFGLNQILYLFKLKVVLKTKKMSLNKVMLIGNLGIDPVVKYLENNRVVAQFTLATNEAFLDKNGERKVETEWHNIELWDQLAKSVDQLKLKGLLKKGTQVYIEGKIRSEMYKDANGLEVMRKKIKASQVQLLGMPKSNTQSMNEPPQEG